MPPNQQEVFSTLLSSRHAPTRQDYQYLNDQKPSNSKKGVTAVAEQHRQQLRNTRAMATTLLEHKCSGTKGIRAIGVQMVGAKHHKGLFFDF